MQSGFTSTADQHRIAKLESEAAELAHQLTQSRMESDLFSKDAQLKIDRPSRTEKLEQVGLSKVAKPPSAHPRVQLHMGDSSANVLSAISSITKSASPGTQPPVINIYVGGSQQHADASQAATSESGEKSLLRSLESKLQDQGNEIARLLSARRIPANLQAGDRNGSPARLQLLSQIASKRSKAVHIDSIEAQIDATLNALAQAHKRIRVSLH